MKIGIYARVSTTDQDCAMQLRELRGYAAPELGRSTNTSITVFRERKRHGRHLIGLWRMLA